MSDDASFFSPVLRGALRVAVVLLAGIGLLGCAATLPPGARPQTGSEPCLAENARLFTFSGQDSLAEARLLDIRSQGLHSWLEFEPALRQSLDYVKLQPQDRQAFGRPGPSVTWGQLAESLRDLINLLPRLDRQPHLLAEHFVWFALSPDPRMTSYYTPELEASLTKRPGYDQPIYKRPPDLRTGSQGIYRVAGDRALPYHTRAEVDLEKVLAGRGLEIAWAKDALDLYDLHLEGCGRLRLPDGSSRDVVYSVSNGRPFTSLGTTLKRGGYLPPNRLGSKDIRAFFDRHPELLPKLMAENERYVFFEFSGSGARGALGSGLTPMVSVAVDPKVLPLGAMLILDAHAPGRDIRGLALAQDTGRAIKGARLDYYTGVGRAAGDLAQTINTPVRVFLLVSRKALQK